MSDIVHGSRSTWIRTRAEMIKSADPQAVCITEMRTTYRCPDRVSTECWKRSLEIDMVVAQQCCWR